MSSERLCRTVGLAFVMAVTACGRAPDGTTSETPASSGSTKPSVPTPTASNATPEVAAVEFAQACFAGDRARALAVTLSFEEMQELSTRTGEKADWDELVASVVDSLIREGKEGAITVAGAKVLKSGTLDPATNEKVKRVAKYAQLQLEVSIDQKPPQPAGIPLLFVETPTGWKYSPKN